MRHFYEIVHPFQKIFHLPAQNYVYICLDIPGLNSLDAESANHPAIQFVPPGTLLTIQVFLCKTPTGS